MKEESSSFMGDKCTMLFIRQINMLEINLGCPIVECIALPNEQLMVVFSDW